MNATRLYARAEAAPGRQLLLQFAYLQVLDLLTTVAFLLSGVKEGNPVVRWAMSVSGDPLTGLALVKLAALGLGLTCWYTSRTRLLSRVNVFFALLIAWNLVNLILGLGLQGTLSREIQP